MALFSKNPKGKKEGAATPAAAPVAAVSSASSSRARAHARPVLIAPRITEKGAYLAESGCYVFDVSDKATKREIAQAVAQLYKVTPSHVRTIRSTRKVTQTRGTNRTGRTAGSKKAYVYLKKGEKIELS